MLIKEMAALQKWKNLGNYFQVWQGEPIRRGRAKQKKAILF
jgi:hypothetical protein